MEVMTKEFVLDILEVCSKHGYVPDIFVRNMKIQMDYKQLLAMGTKSKKARKDLSDKYCTSIKNIEFILYGKKKNEHYQQFIRPQGSSVQSEGDKQQST